MLYANPDEKYKIMIQTIVIEFTYDSHMSYFFNLKIFKKQILLH